MGKSTIKTLSVYRINRLPYKDLKREYSYIRKRAMQRMNRGLARGFDSELKYNKGRYFPTIKEIEEKYGEHADAYIRTNLLNANDFLNKPTTITGLKETRKYMTEQGTRVISTYTGLSESDVIKEYGNDISTVFDILHMIEDLDPTASSNDVLEDLLRLRDEGTINIQTILSDIKSGLVTDENWREFIPETFLSIDINDINPDDLIPF